MADLILIAGHGPVAAGLKEAAEVIVGDKYPILAAPPYEGDVEQIDQAVAAALEQAGPDGRLFVLTDLLGGSVNTRIAGITDLRITLITGVNLGLVVELATAMRRLTPERLSRLISTARDGLQLVELSDDTREEDF